MFRSLAVASIRMIGLAGTAGLLNTRQRGLRSQPSPDMTIPLSQIIGTCLRSVLAGELFGVSGLGLPMALALPARRTWCWCMSSMDTFSGVTCHPTNL